MIKVLISIFVIALFIVIRYFHKRNYYIFRNARKEQDNDEYAEKLGVEF